MKTRWMFVLAVLTASVATRAAAADLRPMVVHDLTGDLHVEQPLPLGCGSVDYHTPVVGGEIEISPAEGIAVPGGRSFTMTAASVQFATFETEGTCAGYGYRHAYRELGVELASGVSFEASAAGAGVYTFSVPARDAIIREASIANDAAGMPPAHDAPEIGYQHPREPVTGTIDLARQTFQMRVITETAIEIPAGGRLVGRLTAEVSGPIRFPDRDKDGIPDRSDDCPLAYNPHKEHVASP